MKISDQIGLAVTNLSRRKGRTALTVVGVVVGICAVIVMISMGIAESHNNDEMLKNMGGLTKIEVYNYGSQNINGQEVKLDNEAVQRFRKIDHVTAVTPYYQPDLNLYVEAGKNNRYRASYVWSVLGLTRHHAPAGQQAGKRRLAQKRRELRQGCDPRCGGQGVFVSV